MKPLVSCLPAVLAAGFLACGGPRSGAGFRLPAGDPDRGKAALVELKCNECHTVAGVELPAEPPVPVALGGEIPHVKTDGELLTSIINPNHRIAAGYRTEMVVRDGKSRMPDYGDLMTVRQAVDIVSLLQSRYQVVRPGEPYASR
jgi:mono/diheme cytochrome c family protein